MKLGRKTYAEKAAKTANTAKSAQPQKRPHAQALAKQFKAKLFKYPHTANYCMSSFLFPALSVHIPRFAIVKFVYLI